jgi:BlaI family penicillinase repressor
MTRRPTLSRRERQVVDLLYRLSEASAADLREAMTDPPSDSAVRAVLSVLVEKGQVRFRRDGRRYLYAPKLPQTQARRSALRHVVETFFAGSAEQAVAALLDAEARRLSPSELDRIAGLIEDARGRR